MINRRRALYALLGAGSVLYTTVARSDLLSTVLDVKAFAQTKSNDCWLAAAVILFRWKNGIPASELDVAKMAGPNYEIAFNQDTGLNGTEFAEFAAALGLVTEAPQNFMPSGYDDLLKAHGPLWIASRLDVSTANSRRHVRVLRGVTGDGSFDGSTAWVLDPDGGRDYQETMTQFAQELEQIAKEEIDAGNELYSQVIRFP